MATTYNSLIVISLTCAASDDDSHEIGSRQAVEDEAVACHERRLELVALLENRG